MSPCCCGKAEEMLHPLQQTLPNATENPSSSGGTRHFPVLVSGHPALSTQLREQTGSQRPHGGKHWLSRLAHDVGHRAAVAQDSASLRLGALCCPASCCPHVLLKGTFNPNTALSPFNRIAVSLDMLISAALGQLPVPQTPCQASHHIPHGPNVCVAIPAPALSPPGASVQQHVLGQAVSEQMRNEEIKNWEIFLMGKNSLIQAQRSQARAACP